MPGASAAWNTALYGSPLWADYSVERALLAVAGEELRTFPNYTRVHGIRPTVIQATISQTAAQFAAFKTFFETDLNLGLAWFTMDLQTPNGPISGLAHIESYSPENVGRGLTHSKTSMAIEWVPG